MASELRIKTQEAVDNVRDLVDGCDLAMLIDRETGLVLCKSSQGTVPQDQLDKLAGSAQTELNGTLATALTNSASEGDVLSSFNVGKDKVIVVLKSQGLSEDALVCQFTKLPNRSDLQDAAEAIFTLSTEVEAA